MRSFQQTLQRHHFGGGSPAPPAVTPPPPPPANPPTFGDPSVAAAGRQGSQNTQAALATEGIQASQQPSNTNQKSLIGQ